MCDDKTCTNCGDEACSCHEACTNCGDWADHCSCAEDARDIAEEMKNAN